MECSNDCWERARHWPQPSEAEDSPRLRILNQLLTMRRCWCLCLRHQADSVWMLSAVSFSCVSRFSRSSWLNPLITISGAAGHAPSRSHGAAADRAAGAARPAHSPTPPGSHTDTALRRAHCRHDGHWPDALLLTSHTLSDWIGGVRSLPAACSMVGS